MHAVVQLATADGQLSCQLAKLALQLLDAPLLCGQQNLHACISTRSANAGNLSTTHLAGTCGLDPATKLWTPVQETGRHVSRVKLIPPPMFKEFPMPGGVEQLVRLGVAWPDG